MDTRWLVLWKEPYDENTSASLDLIEKFIK